MKLHFLRASVEDGPAQDRRGARWGGHSCPPSLNTRAAYSHFLHRHGSEAWRAIPRIAARRRDYSGAGSAGKHCVVIVLQCAWGIVVSNITEFRSAHEKANQSAG